MASVRVSGVTLQELNASCAVFSGRSGVSGLHQLHASCAPDQTGGPVACVVEFPELDG